MIPMPAPSEVEPQPLPVGAAVGSFVLRGVHSRDAFGIRYLATASSSGGEVLIDEFAPAGISTRDATGLLAPRSTEHAALWDEGLQAFLQESQVLAAPLHPALMRVAALWQIRGTAFRMWPRVEGRTLAELGETMRKPPTEAWLHGLMGPLLDALGSLHGAGWVHGNVRPGQILCRSEGGPMLLDTGAVQKAIGARMPQRLAWPEPGFRPPELSDNTNDQVPGPWSDLYSLAAVARYLGQAPCRAQDWAPLTARAMAPQASRFVMALEQALLSTPDDRPQSVEAFRRQLLATVERPSMAIAAKTALASAHEPNVADVDTTELRDELEPRQPWLEPMHADRPWEDAAFQAPRAQRWPKVAAGLMGVLMLAAVAAYQLNGYQAAPKPGTETADAIERPLPARSPSAAGEARAATPEILEAPASAAVPAATPLAPAHASLPPTPPPDPRPAPAPPQSAGRPVTPAGLPSRPAPSLSAVAAFATPAAACAPRTQFALYRCMMTQCEQRRFADHPQCAQLRLTGEPPG